MQTNITLISIGLILCNPINTSISAAYFSHKPDSSATAKHNQ